MKPWSLAQTGNVGDQTWSKIVWPSNISLFGPCLIVSDHKTFPVWTELYRISFSLPFVVDSWRLVELVLQVALRCLLGQLLIPHKYHFQLALAMWGCPQWVDVHFSCNEKHNDWVKVVHSVGNKLPKTWQIIKNYWTRFLWLFQDSDWFFKGSKIHINAPTLPSFQS